MDLHKAASKVDQTDEDSPPLENFYSLSLESQVIESYSIYVYLSKLHKFEWQS